MRARTIARNLAITVLLLALTSLTGEDTTYVIRKGDTLYSISRRFEVPIGELVRANGLSEGAPILVGKTLVIPMAAADPLAACREPETGSEPGFPPLPSPAALPSPAVRSYVAKAGDTFYGIARSQGVGLDGLLKANGLSKSSVLKPGQRLVIPGTGRVAEAAPGPSAAPAKSQAPRIEPGSSLSWPVAGQRSYMTGKLYGIQIRSQEGATVRAVASGKVLSAGPYRGFGQIVVVTRNDKYIYIYGGHEKLYVKAGEEIRPGTVLGELGVDSKGGGPLMYFMAFKNGKAQDPARSPRD